MSTTEPAVERALRYAQVPLTEVNVRDPQGTGDGSWLMEGYAAVFDERTTLFDGQFYRVTEDIDPGAFSGVLERLDLLPGESGRTLVHLNYGHDMQSSVASTDVEGVGGLQLTSDERGLRFEARVDPQDPDAQRMAVKMRRGVVNQASFAFTIAREENITTDLEDGRTEDHFRILEVGNLFDVCACARGAYQQTVSQLRSYAAAIGRSSSDEGREGRSPEGPETVAPEVTAGGDTHQHEATLLDMRRRLLIAKRRVSL